eukprot:11187939-Lingulodinium_polyedra.AAC.1
MARRVRELARQPGGGAGAARAGEPARRAIVLAGDVNATVPAEVPGIAGSWVYSRKRASSAARRLRRDTY